LVSAAVTLPYTFLTFHFVHGEQHLTRSTYLSIPLACLLLIWLPTWRHRFLRDPDRAPGVDPWHNLRWKRVAFALGVCVFIGAWETMTTAFALSLLFVSAVVGAIRWHEWRRLVVGGVGIAVIAVTFVAVSAPSLLYWHRHGSNPVAGHRAVAEAELYGLKLNRLVLPADGSRLHFLQVLGDQSQAQSPVLSEGGQSMGILFVLGFFGALYAAVAGVRRARAGRRSDPRRPEDREAMRETIGLVVIAAIVLGTVGGLSTILSMIGFAQIRAWNRISPFIAFFALLQVLLWSERLVPWARQRWRSRWLRPVLAIGAVAACVLTIALGPPVEPVNPSAVAASFASDQTIVTQIEQVLPPGSNVMQVPYLWYPEEYDPPGTIQDYDPLRPFLADPTGNLNWSYGGLIGRPQADWQAKVTPTQTAADLPALIGMGFTGLWVDTLGYTDAGRTVGEIQRTLAEKPLRSPDGRFLFYDLRPFKDRLGLSDAQLRAMATGTFGIAPPG
jgi:phosphoglycerol transferase